MSESETLMMASREYKELDDKFTIPELKGICKQNDYGKGYTSFNKHDLICFILRARKAALSQPKIPFAALPKVSIHTHTFINA